MIFFKVLAFTSLLALSAQPVFAQTMLGGSPERQGRSNLAFPAEVELAWKKDLGEVTSGSAPIVDGRGNSYWPLRSNLVKLDTHGNEAWRIGTSKVQGVPVLAGDIVVLQSLDGVFTGVGATDGQKRWETSPSPVSGRRIASSPLYDPISKRVFATVHSQVISLDPKTGQKEIIFDTGDRRAEAHGSIVLTPSGKLVVSNWNGNIWAIDTEGNLLWKSLGHGKRLSAPISVDGRLYLVSNNALKCFDEEGKEMWRKRVAGVSGRRFLSALADGRIIVPLSRGIAVFGDRGRLSWKRTTKAAPMAPIFSDMHSQIWMTSDGGLVAFSPSGTPHRFRLSSRSQGPVVGSSLPQPTLFVSDGRHAKAFRAKR